MILVRIIMVKHIMLNCNEEFFYKMQKDKIKREQKLRENTKHDLKLTWEEYVYILFGFRKYVK